MEQQVSMFTFGVEQYGQIRDAVVIITGAEPEEARSIMVALYGREWSGQYTGSEMERYLAKYPTTVVRRVSVGAARSAFREAADV